MTNSISSIPVRTISSFGNANITRIIEKAHEARMINGKSVRVTENGLSCKFVTDVANCDARFEEALKKRNEEDLDITKMMVGPGVKTTNGIYILHAVEAFRQEVVNNKEETIFPCYFESKFIDNLVDKAFKKAKKYSGPLDTYNVCECNLRCHYVVDIQENDTRMLAAIHLWNLAQDGFRKMVIGKGFKTKKAIYVIYNDRYIDSIGSFWKFYN